MISFMDFPTKVINFNQTGVIDDLDGGTGIAFNISDWSKTNPQSGSETSWGLRLQIGGSDTPRFRVRSVVIDNTNNIYPVFLSVSDSDQVIQVDPFDHLTRRIFTSSPFVILYIVLPYLGSFSPVVVSSTFVLLTDASLTEYSRAKPVYNRGSVNMLRQSSLATGIMNNDPIQPVVADNYFSGELVASPLGNLFTVMTTQANVIRRMGYLCAWRIYGRNAGGVAALAAVTLEAVDNATGALIDTIDLVIANLPPTTTVLLSQMSGLQLKHDLLGSSVRARIVSANINMAFGVTAAYGHHAY